MPTSENIWDGWEDARKPPPMDIGIMSSNTRMMHSYESPSTNGIGSARALGRLAGAMANGGVLAQSEGGSSTRVLEASSIAAMHAAPTLAFDTGTHDTTNFTQGGVCAFGREGGMDNEPECDGWMGWGGLGGSMFVWHPEKKLGFAYTHNGPMRESPFGFKDPRCLRLVRAVLACHEKLG